MFCILKNYFQSRKLTFKSIRSFVHPTVCVKYSRTRQTPFCTFFQQAIKTCTAKKKVLQKRRIDNSIDKILY